MQSDSGKLFIGGISWDTNEERLKEYFSSFGEVVEAIIMKDRTTGRSRGFGFIIFADPVVAERVIREKHDIDGRMVEAKKAVPREDYSVMSRTSGSIQGSPGPSQTKKIFVGGLASTVTESDFKMYFDQFGTITDVVVMYDHNTQRPRGFGFITYDLEEAVDRVLLKTFHKLNGKMVEVKRAVPKELSPGPSRSPLGYNYGLSRVSNFLMGHSPSSAGSYVPRMDGRFIPISAGRSAFPAFGSTYGMRANFEQGLNPSFGGNTNFNSNLGYGRGMNPYYMNNSNRFGSLVGYDGSNGGNSSFFSSVSRNLWGNSAGSSAYIRSGSASNGGSTFANPAVSWGSPALPAHGGRQNALNNVRNSSYGSLGHNYGLGAGGYGRNTGMNIPPPPPPPPSSYASSNGGFNGTSTDFNGSGSVYGDTTWRSNSEREAIGPISYGLGYGSSNVSARSPPGYVGGHSANKRQSNRGITT